MSVCLLGFNVAFKHHTVTVPACSSGTFVQCAATQKSHAADTGHDTPPRHSILTVHRANLSLCYLLMWNITMEYKTTHFNVLGLTRSGNQSG